MPYKFNPFTGTLDIVNTTGGGGGGNNFSVNEKPSGTINDSNVTFTLAHTPIVGTVSVYVNRLRLDLPTLVEYSITGTTITLVNPVGSGGSIIVDYQY